MRRSIRLAPYACLLLLSTFLSACGSSGSQATPTIGSTATALPLATIPPKKSFSVALVTDVGGIHDRSFNELAWRGIKRAKKRFKISVRIKQSVSESNYAPNLRRFAQHYATLIVAVGYTMSRAVYDVAHQFPQQRFAMVDARPIDPAGHEVRLRNVENILFKEQESGYLAGAAAGLLEKSRAGKATHNTIGYLGGGPIPAVTRYLGGYVAGARKVDPTIHVVGGFSNTFIDPKRGRSLGLKQISRGADILFQVAGQTGDGYLGAAKKRGVYGIGSDVDESSRGSYIIASAIKHVDIAVAASIAAALHRKFSVGDHRYGAAQGATGVLLSSNPALGRIRQSLLGYVRQVVAGKIVPPTSIPAR